MELTLRWPSTFYSIVQLSSEALLPLPASSKQMTVTWVKPAGDSIFHHWKLLLTRGGVGGEAGIALPLGSS